MDKKVKLGSILARSVQPSVTMAITDSAKKLKKEGKNILSMSPGEPDFDTPDFIKEAAIEALKKGYTKYTPASGLPELKEAVVGWYELYRGVTFSSKNIVISCGAKHAIFNVLMAVLNPGDEVIVPSPYWVSYPEQLRLLGAVPVIAETTDGDNFKVTPAVLERIVTDKTKMIILNSPSNPTGMVYSKDELEKIVEFALKRDLYILSDEIYEELVYDGNFVSLAAFKDTLAEKLCVVSGVSKSYSMTGWRIGYAIVPEWMSKVIGSIQSHMTSNPCSIAQYAVLEALTSEQSHNFVKQIQILFSERRDRLVSGLRSIDGVSCLMPQGAFYVFPRIDTFFGKRSGKVVINDSISFCKALLQDVGVACVPGLGFGSDQHVRLSYSSSLETIDEAVKRIKSWLKTLV